ncbi:zinc finger protein 385D-like [Corythoichthys intestinalis]|uniref:zinc finger protein 385D-like n=1 Tax=Corythoichthys intestinalis TaxID=161448 RepID=UPI0025A594A2|nr:zinc finger protein 385D-like [Corythoichthys intestinalis]
MMMMMMMMMKKWWRRKRMMQMGNATSRDTLHFYTCGNCRRTSMPFETRESSSEAAATRTTEKEQREDDVAKRLLYCSLCKVAVNSASQLQAHNSGIKHKTMLEARRGDGAIKSFPRLSVGKAKIPSAEASGGLRDKTFRCQICDVHVNSDTQLKQHISSRRHKDRAAGKKTKPKYKPYTPAQQPLSFQTKKHEVLPSFLLHHQFLASFGLHPTTNAVFKFQSPPIQQALMQTPLAFPSHY